LAFTLLNCAVGEDTKMPKWGYSEIAEELDQEKTVKASGREVRVSHKHAREICRTVKGMMLNQAKTYLLDVMEKKKAVPFRRYQKKAGHRRGLDKAFAGRYPIKAAEKILKIIQGAQANAENKGLDVDKLRIIHAAAYPGMKVKRFTPRAHGRASPKFDTLTHVEIVLGETPGQGVEA
jgi:large subunit ribosomal protein L22